MIEKIHGSSDPSEWIREKLQAIVHPVKSAVDIASGAGRHSLLLSELCPSVTAVDRNPDLSQLFCKHVGGIPVSGSRARRLAVGRLHV